MLPRTSPASAASLTFAMDEILRALLGAGRRSAERRPARVQTGMGCCLGLGNDAATLKRHADQACGGIDARELKDQVASSDK